MVKGRVVLALITAPLAAGLASALVVTAHAFATRDVAGIDAIALGLYTFLIAFAISTPVAYLTAMLVSLISYSLLEHGNHRRTATMSVAMASFGGGVMWPLAWHWYANAEFGWLYVMTGIMAGLVGGLVFWHVV